MAGAQGNVEILGESRSLVSKVKWVKDCLPI